MSIADLRLAILQEKWVEEVTEEIGGPPHMSFTSGTDSHMCFGVVTRDDLTSPDWVAPYVGERIGDTWCYDCMPYCLIRPDGGAEWYIIRLSHYTAWAGREPPRFKTINEILHNE